MRRFRTRADSARALMPAALAVLSAMLGSGGFFLLERKGPGADWTCPACRCVSYFWRSIRGVDPVWKTDWMELYECARCGLVISSGEYYASPGSAT